MRAVGTATRTDILLREEPYAEEDDEEDEGNVTPDGVSGER